MHISFPFFFIKINIIDIVTFFQTISIEIFTNLLPYFPGRSAHSLQSRFKTLRRWAILWYNLREQITGRLEDSFSCVRVSHSYLLKIFLIILGAFDIFKGGQISGLL